MAVGRDQILTEIETHWTLLVDIIAHVPANRMENAVVVGSWSVKDLLGHITTWESETIGNIERFLDPQRGDMRFLPGNGQLHGQLQ